MSSQASRDAARKLNEPTLAAIASLHDLVVAQGARIDSLRAEVAALREAPDGRRPPGQRVGTSELASLLGRSAGYVRNNAEQLGGKKTGEGPKPRWSFDRDHALMVYEGHPIASEWIPSDGRDDCPDERS